MPPSEIFQRDGSWRPPRGVLAAAAAVMVVANEELAERKHKRSVVRAKHINRDEEREVYIKSIIYESDAKCLSNMKMTREAFHNLCKVMKERDLLQSNGNITVEEQLFIFLQMIGHNVRIRVMKDRIFRSGETIHRYFRKVLKAILKLHKTYIHPPSSSIPHQIAEDARMMPWFKDCIGAIDGTHIRASVPIADQPRFRGRKDKTSQNVMVAVSFDLKFTYVLAGWEGSAHDATILENALTRPNGLVVPEGKFFLADAGYGIRSGFIPPYRSVRYHLKEFSENGPENEKELFNLRHSSLRTTVERAFGILKKRWRVLDAEPFWSYETQVDLVLACCILHNHVMGVNPQDRILIKAEKEYQLMQLARKIQPSRRRARTHREERDESRLWSAKRDMIANDMYNNYVMQDQ